uniref:Uncharacterized protein n=1 Tax=Anopheles melas TaxID=34690 RepID=A0A182TNL4_9DIPT
MSSILFALGLGVGQEHVAEGGRLEQWHRKHRTHARSNPVDDDMLEGGIARTAPLQGGRQHRVEVAARVVERCKYKDSCIVTFVPVASRSCSDFPLPATTRLVPMNESMNAPNRASFSEITFDASRQQSVAKPSMNAPSSKQHPHSSAAAIASKIKSFTSPSFDMRSFRRRATIAKMQLAILTIEIGHRLADCRGVM